METPSPDYLKGFNHGYDCRNMTLNF